MSRWSFIVGPATRARLHQWLDRARDGMRIEFSEPARTDAQNRLLWPLLTALSEQVVWGGLTLSPEDWKDIMTAGLRREIRTALNIDRNGYVMLGMRTSRMTKAEFSELIELIRAFGAREGVDFGDQHEAAA